MEQRLKYTGITAALIGVLGLTLLFTACESPSEVVLSPFDEDKAYFEFVMTNEDFFTSEEDILNDPEDNLGRVSSDDGQEILPLRVLRRVKDIDRSFSFEFIDDTVVIVTMTRTMDVRLLIFGQIPPEEGEIGEEMDITKDFTETATRKAKFLKVNNTGTAENDWKLVAVSLLEGGTSERDFNLNHLKLDFPGDQTFGYDDPLNTFLRVGLGTREVPVVALSQFRQRGYALEITLQSENPQPEILYLRHGGNIGGQIGVGGYMRRAQVPFDDQEYHDGVYTRTYIIDWDPFAELHGVTQRGDQIRRGRFSTVVEAVSYKSVYNTAAPVQTNYWGVPFIIE